MKITNRWIPLVGTALALAFLGGIALAPTLVSTAAAQIAGAPAPATENRGGPGGADLFKVAADLIGITVDQLRTEMGTDKSMAAVAVAHGKTRDGLIAALTTAEAARFAQLVDQKGAPQRPRGPASPGRPGFPGGPAFGVRADPFQAAATYLGTTAADLQTKLRAGQTLAQIATAAGKTRDGLIQAIVQDETAKIDRAVKDGKLTADQATRLKTELAERVKRLVDRSGPPFGPRGGRP